jgi:hypothetical protein
MKHTPGPWVLERMRLPPRARDRRCGFVVNGPDLTDDLPVRVCDLRAPRGMDGFGEAEANAHLIAAAPELLAACEAALNAMIYHGVAFAERDTVLAAIAKAKGGGE